MFRALGWINSGLPLFARISKSSFFSVRKFFKMSFAELTVPKPSRARFPSVRVAKIPAVLLLVAGGVSAFVLIELGPYSRISLAFSISLMAVGIAGLVVRHAAVVDICLMAASIAVVVYAGEAGIEGLREFSAWRESNLKIQYAASQGRSFDLR